MTGLVQDFTIGGDPLPPIEGIMNFLKERNHHHTSLKEDKGLTVLDRYMLTLKEQIFDEVLFVVALIASAFLIFLLR